MTVPRVGVDLRMWTHAGIGRYVRELVRQPAYRAFKGSFNFYGYAEHEKEIRACLPGKDSHFVALRSKIYSPGEQIELASKTGALDLLHAPHFNVPLMARARLVVTVHDLTYIRHPSASKSYFAAGYTRFLLRFIQKRASAILTVSEHTRKDLFELFPRLAKDRVIVTPEAPASIFKKLEDPDTLGSTRKQFQLYRPFVLFVGSLKIHKNVALLVRALENLRNSKGIEHELVLVGRPDAGNRELLRLIEKSAFIRYLGEVEDSTLVSLYNLADLFVLPSWYEGFGLPVLEAMACGTPVIASDRTSLPELVGDAGKTFDPYRVDALEPLIYNVLKNNELRENMRRAGLQRVKRFSWQKTAEATVKVYEEVLGRF
ncbi:MAG: glycosyltransferase family 4 protein [Candidatus Omnitrophica bacterium]|nr:glycosyltransferase family 4 protein [Candidatus Omnitrophota bacterium]